MVGIMVDGQAGIMEDITRSRHLTTTEDTTQVRVLCHIAYISKKYLLHV